MKRIHPVTGYFDDDVAKKYSDTPTLFISDIRTADSKSM